MSIRRTALLSSDQGKRFVSGQHGETRTSIHASATLKSIRWSCKWLILLVWILVSSVMQEVGLLKSTRGRSIVVGFRACWDMDETQEHEWGCLFWNGVHESNHFGKKGMGDRYQ